MLLVIFSLTNQLRLFRPFLSPGDLLECGNTQLCTPATFSSPKQWFFTTHFLIFHSSFPFWELNFGIPSRNLCFGGCTPSPQLSHASNSDRERSFLSNHRFLLKILRDQRSIKTITCTFQKKYSFSPKKQLFSGEKIKRSSALLCFVLLKVRQQIWPSFNYRKFTFHVRSPYGWRKANRCREECVLCIQMKHG